MSRTSSRTAILSLCFGGLSAAVVGFLLTERGSALFWPPNERNVAVHARFDGDQLVLLVGNDSGQIIDILRADLELMQREQMTSLGAFPEITQVYDLSTGDPTKVGVFDDRVTIGANVAHSIKPGARDQFAFRLVGVRQADIEDVRGVLVDAKDRTFNVDFRE